MGQPQDGRGPRVPRPGPATPPAVRHVGVALHFAPKFCRRATATEKPRVENRVYDLQRQWATPVPRIADLAELNVHLRRCCLVARDRTCGDQKESEAVRFEQDRAAALPVLAHPFDACIIQAGQVDKYQTVRFDGKVDRVEIVAGGQAVARRGAC